MFLHMKYVHKFKQTSVSNNAFLDSNTLRIKYAK